MRSVQICSSLSPLNNRGGMKESGPCVSLHRCLSCTPLRRSSTHPPTPNTSPSACHVSHPLNSPPRCLSLPSSAIITICTHPPSVSSTIILCLVCQSHRLCHSSPTVFRACSCLRPLRQHPDPSETQGQSISGIVKIAKHRYLTPYLLAPASEI